GGDRDIGVAKQQVGEIVGRQEARIDETDDDGESDDRDRQHRLLRGDSAQDLDGGTGRAHAACPRPERSPIIAAPTALGVASARGNSATMRPSRITSTRSLMPSTSGNSLEIIRIATPSLTSTPIKL